MTPTRAFETEIRLPKPPGLFRSMLARHPRAVDIFIVVWYFIGVGIGVLIDISMNVDQRFVYDVDTGEWYDSEGALVADPPAEMFEWLGPPDYMLWPWGILAVARVLAVAAALFFRRKYPFAGLIVTTVALFGEHGIQSLATSVAFIFLLYAVPVYRSVAAGWVGFGIAVVATVLGILPSLWPATQHLVFPVGVNGPSDEFALSFGQFLTIVIMSVLWYLAVLLLGINLGNRRRYLAAVIDRAHQLARERDQLAQLAVAEERSRIAREMHDIVAHSVSVMIALSEGASRTVSVAPEAAADAMSRSAETGRTALAEMRRLLGALHDPEAQQADMLPQPGVDALPDLVDSFTSAGLHVTLSVDGAASGDRGQDLAVYRVVQEGLTNTLRYAGPGSRAEVSVCRLDGRTIVRVRDFGPVSDRAPAAGLGSGRGITGLRERARMFGGEITAGPSPFGAGWSLEAELPVNAEARERSADPSRNETTQNTEENDA